MFCKRLLFGGLILCGHLLVIACTPTLLDQNWGRSVKTAGYNQTLNPGAGKDLKPVEGMDGRNAANTLKAHHQSFGTQKKSADLTIQVTGGK